MKCFLLLKKCKQQIKEKMNKTKVYVPPNKRKQQNMFVFKEQKFRVKQEDFPEICKPQIKQENVLDWSKATILEQTEMDLKPIIKEDQEDESDIENQKVYYQMSNELAKSIVNRHDRYEEENSYKDINYGYLHAWQILKDILTGDEDEYEDEYEEEYEEEDEYKEDNIV